MVMFASGLIGMTIILVGLYVLIKYEMQDRYDNRWVEYNEHPFIGSEGRCIVWSVCGTDQCGLGPEDHVYDREDCGDEW